MRVVIQRVKRATCKVASEVVGKCDKGYLLLVGFKEDDDLSIITKIADKIAGMRIFDDEEGKMNLDIFAVKGTILSISQFTLYADTSKGNRPSFAKAMNSKKAGEYYDLFNKALRNHGLHVEEGIFGADMQVELINDGPVTIELEG